MDTFRHDLRFALRTLARRPAFTAAVVATLALGLGATTAIYSVAQAVLFEGLPFEEPSALVHLWERKEGRDKDNVVSPANFFDWSRQATSYEALAGLWRNTAPMSGVDEPVEVQVGIASVELFEVLRLQPVAGRFFAPDDVEEGQFAGDFAVLSHDYWMRRFGGDPEAVGKTVTLWSDTITILGVAPASARLVDPRAEMWLPTDFSWADRQRSGRFIRAIARLAPGVSREQAQAEIETITARLAAEHPDFNTGWSARLVPLRDELVGEVRPALFLLLGAVGLLLLVACSNVANLLLARATGREQEIAVRSALGAGAARIFRQLLVEGLVLALAAGAAGLALAVQGTKLLIAAVPRDLVVPRLDEVGLDANVLAFTAAVTLATGLVFGLVPALGTRNALSARLREGGQREAGSARQRWVKNALVVVEVALAVVLATGAGLLFRSFVELRGVDTGLELDGVLTARVTLFGERYREDEARIAFFREAQERLAALPGVASAGTINWIPLSGRTSRTSFFVEDRPRPAVGDEPVTGVRFVTPGYFEAAGMPLVSGRAIDERDGADATAVVVVNQAMAREHWTGEDPVGKRLSYSWADWESVEVIGVVGDVYHRGIEEGVSPAVFRPFAQDPMSSTNFVLRAEVTPSSLVAAVTGAIHEIDADVPVANFRTLEEYYSGSMAQPRLNMILMSSFSLLALVLAAVGVYGVIAYSVAQRTREIGVRMALGAERFDILGLVVRHALGLAAAGVVFGLVAARALVRLLESLLYGVSTTDAWTFAAVPLVLLAAAFCASVLPARRASRVEPTVALRYE